MAIRKTDKGYYVEVFLGNDPLTNKKIRKTKTFRKLKDAKDWELNITQSYKNGELDLSKNITVFEYLEYWYDTYVIANTKYNTQKRYRTLLECIQSHIGHIVLVKLRTPHVDRFYADLKLEMITLKDKTTKRRYRDGTILKVHKLFKQAIDKAVTWDIVVKNYVNGATAPRDDKKEIDSWNIKEVNQFLEEIQDTKLYLPVFIAFHTGLRQGEISALRWENINFKEGYLMVEHNFVEKKGIGLVLEEPKTESSKAKVMMTTDLQAKLEEIRTENKKHKLKTGINLEYVCSWEDGKPIRPNYISKTFKKYVDKSNLKKITFHGLRHSHATILYSAGANSQEISKRLRHSRVSTTDDIYIHVTEEIKKSTAQIFDKAIDQGK